MRLTPHDMAKLGYLYLRNGVWDGKRIIPAAWVERARRGGLATDFGKYANLWWSIPDRDAFMALGRHGQSIVVLPTLDIVAVLTGVIPDNERRYPVSAVIDRIVAAVKSDQPLPPDPEGEAALGASLLKAASEKAAPVGPASDLLGEVSNKTWRFGDNDLRIRAIRLNLLGDSPTFELTIYSDKPGGREVVLSETDRARWPLAPQAYQLCLRRQQREMAGQPYLCARTPLLGERRNGLLEHEVRGRAAQSAIQEYGWV